MGFFDKTKSFKNPNHLNQFRVNMGLFGGSKKKEQASLPPPPPKNPPQGLFKASPVDEQPTLQTSSQPPPAPKIQQPVQMSQQPTPPLTQQSLQPAQPQQAFPANQEQPQTPQDSQGSVQNIQTNQAAESQVSSNIPQNLPKLSIQNFERELSNAPLDNIPFFSDVESNKGELEVLPIIDTEQPQYTNFKYQNLNKPLFIRTDYYSQILSSIERIKSHVVESSEIIYSVENLKRNADMEHEYYKQVLEDIQRKLIYVDKVLFEGGK